MSEYNLTIFDLEEGKEYKSNKNNTKHRIKDKTLQCYDDCHDGNDWNETFLSSGERFKEIKGKKRYWLWRITNSMGKWYKESDYLDENGFNTIGKTYISNWDKIEKEKDEKDFIEV